MFLVRKRIFLLLNYHDADVTWQSKSFAYLFGELVEAGDRVVSGDDHFALSSLSITPILLNQNNMH